jgi:hypothetical protein
MAKPTPKGDGNCQAKLEAVWPIGFGEGRQGELPWLNLGARGGSIMQREHLIRMAAQGGDALIDMGIAVTGGIFYLSGRYNMALLLLVLAIISGAGAAIMSVANPD